LSIFKCVDFAALTTTGTTHKSTFWFLKKATRASAAAEMIPIEEKVLWMLSSEQSSGIE
jgi:hypothetical protein